MTEDEKAAKTILANETDLALTGHRDGMYSVTDKAGRVIGKGSTGADALANAIGSDARIVARSRVHMGIALAVATDGDEALDYMGGLVEDNDDEDSGDDPSEDDTGSVRVRRE